MRKERDYKVYIVDTDGSERLGIVVSAKSKGHAEAIARKSGYTKISDVVPVTED